MAENREELKQAASSVSICSGATSVGRVFPLLHAWFTTGKTASISASKRRNLVRALAIPTNAMVKKVINASPPATKNIPVSPVHFSRLSYTPAGKWGLTLLSFGGSPTNLSDIHSPLLGKISLLRRG